ncbi:uncharacterized protein LOC130949833 [Arachis stenosperma]|uniref:uncharacterized protein LOC130949833 n=1 Tax=Arachis stenosperma TaxID=217475 RepID=UPI0025ABB5AE|nr:uncharacterized protein LOC130949833 [Arachis stenosperma]
MDEHLENRGKHSEPLSKKNEDHLVDMKEKVEEQDEEATVSSETLMENEVVKEKVEEQESEEDNQENPHSSEAEKHMKEELIEPQIQEALDEDETPIITQPPSVDIQEVKATNKSTNPTPEPSASKLNQAIYRKEAC